MNKNLIIASFLIVLSSCSLSEEQRASQLLERAKLRVEKNELDAAKIIIDSIHALFPRQVSVRRQADTIFWRVQISEFSRSMAYIDSLLPIKMLELESLSSDFIFQKDSLYQDIGTYTHRLMTTGRNAQRCYLKPYVDEKGTFFLLSQYCGGVSIRHKSLQVDADGVFLKSEGEGTYSFFCENGLFYESTLFEENTFKGIPDFIIEHQNSRLKVTLLGERNYSYVLTSFDKTAFEKTRILSSYLVDVYRLKQEQEKAEMKIAQLENRLK